jgi:predicted translin family RNA/ssDNA-binding protein
MISEEAVSAAEIHKKRFTEISEDLKIANAEIEKLSKEIAELKVKPGA